MQRTGREVRLPNRCAVCVPFRPLSHLRHEVAHGLGGLVLLLAGGVGVGSQGESGIVMAQHGGHRLDVHTVWRARVAKVWRRLWNRRCSRPASFRMRWCRVATESGMCCFGSECVLYYDESSLFCLFYVLYASLHSDIFWYWESKICEEDVD